MFAAGKGRQRRRMRRQFIRRSLDDSRHRPKVHVPRIRSGKGPRRKRLYDLEMAKRCLTPGVVVEKAVEDESAFGRGLAHVEQNSLMIPLVATGDE